MEKSISKNTSVERPKTRESPKETKKIQQVSNNCSRNNLPWNWPSADVWREIIQYLSFPQKAKLRHVCTYFYCSFFDRQKWIFDSHLWLIGQLFTPGLVFRLLDLDNYLLPSETQANFRREELNKIVAEMKAVKSSFKITNKASPELLRCLYRALQKKRKNFVDLEIVIRFYDESLDAALYKGLILNYFPQLKLPFSNFTRDALKIQCEVNPTQYLSQSLNEDNVEAFQILLEFPERKVRGLRDGFVAKDGLFEMISQREADRIFDFLSKNNIQKRLWMYPQRFIETSEFPKFFGSSTRFSDLLIYYRNNGFKCRKLTTVLKKEDYSFWRFKIGCYSELQPWAIFVRLPELNPWQNSMEPG